MEEDEHALLYGVMQTLGHTDGLCIGNCFSVFCDGAAVFLLFEVGIAYAACAKVLFSGCLMFGALLSVGCAKETNSDKEVAGCGGSKPDGCLAGARRAI